MHFDSISDNLSFSAVALVNFFTFYIWEINFLANTVVNNIEKNYYLKKIATGAYDASWMELGYESPTLSGDDDSSGDKEHNVGEKLGWLVIDASSSHIWLIYAWLTSSTPEGDWSDQSITACQQLSPGLRHQVGPSTGDSKHYSAALSIKNRLQFTNNLSIVFYRYIKLYFSYFLFTC